MLSKMVIVLNTHVCFPLLHYIEHFYGYGPSFIFFYTCTHIHVRIHPHTRMCTHTHACAHMPMYTHNSWPDSDLFWCDMWVTHVPSFCCNLISLLPHSMFYCISNLACDGHTVSSFSMLFPDNRAAATMIPKLALWLKRLTPQMVLLMQIFCCMSLQKRLHGVRRLLPMRHTASWRCVVYYCVVMFNLLKASCCIELQFQVEFDRPIAGFINFCPQELASDDNSPEQNVVTVKHEILHAIVMFQDFCHLSLSYCLLHDISMICLVSGIHCGTVRFL